MAEACSASHTTRQYTAASGVISTDGSSRHPARVAAASRRSPPPGATPSATEAATSAGLIFPHWMSSLTTASATASLLSASSAASSASASPSKARCHRLSISTAAARTEGERSASPRRTAEARNAMVTDATGTLEVSAR